MMRTFLFAVAVAAAACGGKAAPAGDTGPAVAATTCDSLAPHLAELMDQGDEAVGPEHHPVITRLFSERCTADGWDRDIMECLRAADVNTFQACVDQLTEAQREAVAHQVERDLKPLIDKSWDQAHPKDELEHSTDVPTTAPAPAPAPAPKRAPTRRSAPRPDDPCGGGA